MPGTLDYLLQFAKVIASSVADVTKATQVQVSGLEDPLGTGDDELVEDQPVYSGIGPAWRPLKPSTIQGRQYFTEVICTKTGDGLVPIAWRDLRINRAFPSGLAEGQTAFAGYGKGFYSLTLTSANSGSEKANVHVLYCPYQFDASGVPAKAHSIVLDPTTGNESISMTHADGGQFVLLKNKEAMLVADSSTWMHIKPGTFEVQASQISLVGTLYVGSPTDPSTVALTKFLAFASVYDAHTHGTGVGPTTPPIIPITPQASTLATQRSFSP